MQGRQGECTGRVGEGSWWVSGRVRCRVFHGYRGMQWYKGGVPFLLSSLICRRLPSSANPLSRFTSTCEKTKRRVLRCTCRKKRLNFPSMHTGGKSDLK